MKDAKGILENVLAPIQGEARAGHAATALAPQGLDDLPPEIVPYSELERRYVEIMNALLTDALARGALTVFTDVATWKLAVVAHACGPRTAGDILRRLGVHLGTIAEAEEAQAELNRAKDTGLRPN